MPNWLGDAVMATPALANLMAHFDHGELIVVGSPAVAQLLQGLPCRAVLEDPRRKGPLRLARSWQLGRAIRRRYGKIDFGVSFASSLSSRLLLHGAGSKRRVGGRSGRASDLLLTEAVRCDRSLHVSELYVSIINGALGRDDPAGPTWLPPGDFPSLPRPTVGINPGAAYGSAKRWPPERFAAVAAGLAADYDIAIVGGPAEREIGAAIQQRLEQRGVTNYRNWVGETSIVQLLGLLGQLELLVTNDSGPMHIANACGTPVVAIFGSTDHLKTHPWRQENVEVVRREGLACAPCMKRTCPLAHHACMEEVGAEQVLRAARRLASQQRSAA